MGNETHHAPPCPSSTLPATGGSRARWPIQAARLRGTIANILNEYGLGPALERNRKTTWKEFLSWHRHMIVAADFFTIEAWTRSGLTNFLVLFLIEHVEPEGG